MITTTVSFSADITLLCSSSTYLLTLKRVIPVFLIPEQIVLSTAVSLLSVVGLSSALVTTSSACTTYQSRRLTQQTSSIRLRLPTRTQLYWNP
ncbi:hypothetical protein K435DRAFT_377998 [Dendrothele bispora CBS 962.96]|uniref:Uncharacterized protein n=1 Tax=Dendrothele bispora (strain CBS 962.96) TaxID=1314807 RepID=A0A4V4HD58_DENBC|nr:hypothetical protein K435DRAFT_377998 [Dendrothele bispora CBS 962.96]